MSIRKRKKTKMKTVTRSIRKQKGSPPHRMCLHYEKKRNMINGKMCLETGIIVHGDEPGCKNFVPAKWIWCSKNKMFKHQEACITLQMEKSPECRRCKDGHKFFKFVKNRKIKS